MLVKGSFRNVLELRASICLVEPEKLKDSRYTTHETFIDQIALSDVLVANKMDLADQYAIKLFHQWAKNSRPEKALIAQTIQGQLDVTWLDMPRQPKRKAEFPNAHKISKVYLANNTDHQLSNKADGYQSFGHIFPAEICFDFQSLNLLLDQFKVERIKAILNTNKGWFIVNGSGENLQYIPIKPSNNNRIEIITTQHDFQTTLKKIIECKVQEGRRL
jgi:G3E family GTPase